MVNLVNLKISYFIVHVYSQHFFIHLLASLLSCLLRSEQCKSEDLVYFVFPCPQYQETIVGQLNL